MPSPLEFPSRPLPDEGLPADRVLDLLAEQKVEDRDWRGGKVFSLVYFAGDEVHDLAREALSMYSAENGLNVLAFPSIGYLQHDLVQITASLLGAEAAAEQGGEPARVEGYVTSGGTESLLHAVKTARDVARERGIDRPKVIAATSAHAAFTKAADYFDVELVRVPVDAGFRADPAAMAEQVDQRTILLVGSAPSYPQGVIDPIEALGRLALERGLLLHVDACMGGYLLPFLAELGRIDQPFDFRVPGVTSMSADLHKYAYAPKGVSVVCYRTPELARHQVFVTTDWLGGLYASTTVAGTRPAGPIAAAWAVLMHLGRAGYLRLAAKAHDAARELRAGIEAVPGLEVRGDPPATVMAFGAAGAGGPTDGSLPAGRAAARDGATLDIFAVGEELASRGWYFDRQRGPDSLHATVHAGNAARIDEVLADLRTSVAAVGTRQAADRRTTYGTAG